MLLFPFFHAQVLFLATANSLSTIPGPLRDRMEIIEIPGYTQEDKIPIAKDHLVPKQLRLHGLDADKVAFTEEGIQVVGTYRNKLIG